METTIREAKRVFAGLASGEYDQDAGFYLKSTEYEMSEDDIDKLVTDASDDDNALVSLIEASLSKDDAGLFNALYEQVGYERFLYVFDEYFGLSAFFVYTSVSCLSHYLDAQMEDPEAWGEACEQALFNEHESDCWENDWSPSYRSQSLAVLYLLHFKGGLSATSLLKKCIIHGFSAYYAPLVAIGARFEVDNLYLADFSCRDLRDLLEEGLLDELTAHATSEDWAYLTKKLLKELPDEE